MRVDVVGQGGECVVAALGDGDVKGGGSSDLQLDVASLSGNQKRSIGTGGDRIGIQCPFAARVSTSTV